MPSASFARNNMKPQPIACADVNYVRERRNERVFVQPTAHDVLCGRGKDCFRHEGNIRFRALIDTMLSQYTMSNSKKHKMQIIQYVCHYVVEGRGRFLKKDNRNKQWYDGGIACGKDKVGHSFRDAKGQGRRKSSKVLQDLNVQGGAIQDAAVAALSEENRGAVALAAFKMGLNSKPPTTETKDEDALVLFKMGINNKPTTPSNTEPKDEDMHAASSLLFLLQAVETNPTEAKDVEASQQDEETAADLSPSKDAKHSTVPIPQSCSASVPKQSNGANSFYFI